MAIYRRFESALDDLKYSSEFNDLPLKNGWVVTAKDNVVFVINPIKDEDLPNNVDLKFQNIGDTIFGGKLKKISDKVWDCEKYSDLAKLAGFTLDQNTGKIAYKVV